MKPIYTNSPLDYSYSSLPIVFPQSENQVPPEDRESTALLEDHRQTQYAFSSQSFCPPELESLFAEPGFVQAPVFAPQESIQQYWSVDRPQTSQVWGIEFARITMQQAVDLADRIIKRRHPEYFITANLNYMMLTRQHPRLQEINRQCCCVVADGMPIVVRSRLGSHPLPERVTGADMIFQLAKLAAEKRYRLFLLGGAEGVADAAAKRLVDQLPDLPIAGTYSPPFRPLDAMEEEQMIQTIRRSQPDILLVAFGQPKGEIWIADNLKRLNVPLSIQLGASFDFLAGTARRAPRIWQAIGCEWLYRALSDPKRLVPRYWSNLLFLTKLLMTDLLTITKGQKAAD